MSFIPTEEQSAIIELDTGCFLVTAPPGSGKTQVLTQRIIRLLRNSSSEHYRILALTFTTKAAENMRLRIEQEIAEALNRVVAQTFHSFCLDILQHYGEAVGISHNVTVYENAGDRIEALARGLEDYGIVLGRSPDDLRVLSKLLDDIGKLKRQLVSPEAAPTHMVNDLLPLKNAYEAYDRILREYGAVDFDDLLDLVYRLFSDNPRIARHYRRLYRYILIDEAQDTSRAQYEILRLLCGEEHRNVMMVADGDQSIYKFSGANPKYLEKFVEDFHAQIRPLTRNFRCAESIVEAANKLISHTPVKIYTSSRMESATRAKGYLQAVSYQDEASEALEIINKVKGLVAHGFQPQWLLPGEDISVKYEDIGILARNRYALANIISSLEQHGIPYQFSLGENEVFASTEVRFTYHALRLIANPRNLLSKEVVLAQCGLPDPEIELLRSIEGPAFFEAILKSKSGLNRNLIKVFLDFAIRSPEISEIMPSLLDVFTNQLKDTRHSHEEIRALFCSDVDLLRNRWMAYRINCPRDEWSLVGLLGYLSLSARNASEHDGVRVLTVHASKGLEFKAVFLVGFNEGTFPDYRSISKQENLAEEYREAYVALTRASRYLTITRPRMRMMPWGSNRPQTESRFIRQSNLKMLQS